MKQSSVPKQNYDEKQKAKGLVKACFWINPDDFDVISRKCEISRNKLADNSES